MTQRRSHLHRVKAGYSMKEASHDPGSELLGVRSGVLGAVHGALDSLVVTTALPAIGRALHARPSDLEWTINALPSSSLSA
jgi:hypothetical protein